jgi:hypothetical protein
LVPDQNHTVGTSGYGAPAATGTYQTNDYVTVSAAPDGTLALAYFPQGSSLTVAMSTFAASASERWLDPTNGLSTNIGTFSKQCWRRSRLGARVDRLKEQASCRSEEKHGLTSDIGDAVVDSLKAF